MAITTEADPKTPIALLHFLPWHKPDPQPHSLPPSPDHLSLPRILIAQGLASHAANQAAARTGLELVDATAFLEIFSRLHPQLELHLWQLAHAGHPSIPSCPSCRAKLVLVDPSLVHTPASAPSRHIRRDSNLPGDLVARSLTIARGAHVQALGVIWANHIHLKGSLSGNILCSGNISLAPSARLSGFVKARSIRVAEGGSLDATTEIVRDADSQPLLPSHLARWVCPSHSLSACATIALPQRTSQPSQALAQERLRGA